MNSGNTYSVEQEFNPIVIQKIGCNARYTVYAWALLVCMLRRAETLNNWLAKYCVYVRATLNNWLALLVRVSKVDPK